MIISDGVDDNIRIRTLKGIAFREDDNIEEAVLQDLRIALPGVTTRKALGTYNLLDPAF